MNKPRFKNKNKVIQKIIAKNKINENNHIIINLEDSSIVSKDINEDEKATEVDSIIDRLEISKKKDEENKILEEAPTELTEENNEPKLIKPIIIW